MGDQHIEGQYIALLLREEEMIEAIRMVDPLRASEMDKDLENAQKDPWSYVQELGHAPSPGWIKTLTSKRLENLRTMQEAREEAENKAKIKARDDLTMAQDEKETTEALTKLTLSSAAKIPTPPPSPPSSNIRKRNWLRVRRFHDDWLERHHQWRRRMALNDRRRLPDEQFRYANCIRSREAPDAYRIPETLAYRPFDQVSYAAKKNENEMWKEAAKRIRIVVTEH